MDNLPTAAFATEIATLPVAPDGPLVIDEWATAGMASVMTRLSRASLAAERLSALAAPDRHFVDIGPGNWLVVDRASDGRLIATLETHVGDVAQVFDVSSGYALMTLHGRQARPLLQKAFFVDLDKALAADGASCSSMIAHIPATAWQLSADGFAVAIPRSYAASFWHWFDAAAAAEGVRPGRGR